jgi:hypothetical protein
MSPIDFFTEEYMNHKLGILVFAIALCGLSGCVHTHKVQGEEPKSEIPEGVRVGIGGKEVHDGDRVDVLRTVCKTKKHSGVRGRTERVCHDQKLGEALVLKVLDHDSAIVQPQGGLVMDTTMKVEKISDAK